MAEPQPLNPGSPSAPSSPKRRNTASDGSQLRNSCEACASSKVKCSGRKPTCDRCEKRGFMCEYFAAKRAGRKPASSNSSEASSQPVQDAEASREPERSTPQAAYASPEGTASEISDNRRDLGPFDQLFFPDLANSNPTSSGFTPSFPVDLLSRDLSGTTDDLFGSTINSSNDGVESLTNPVFSASHSISDLFAFPLPTPSPTTPASPSREPRSFHNSPVTGHACSCLAQALGLMTRLSELVSSVRKTWTTQGLNESTAIQTVIDVLRQNKAAIDTASSMLYCQGKHDGYLSIIIALTAFKMLELFAAVVLESPSAGAQGRPTSQSSASEPALQSFAVVGSYRIEGKDWARQSAQAVLSELHSVRRLTKSLSSKLQEQATAPNRDGRGQISKVILSPGDATMPFSKGVYAQVGLDLDSRIKALSQEILNRLRIF